MRNDPLGDRTTFVYDAGSYLIEKKDRNDRLCTYAYDALGRLASETWKDAGGTIVNTLTYTYDLNSNLLTAADDDGTYTFTYDALDRVATQKDIWAKTLTFTYDNADNRTLVEDSAGGVTTSVYDADNRLTSRKFDDGTAELRIDFTYTSRDQVATVTRYSDVAGTTQVGSSAYTYDDSMRLTNLQHKNAAGSTLANYTYTYDVADRLTSETRNATAVTYTYDATNQLLTDGTGGGGPYDYDLNGNRTAYTTGADNRLLSDGVYTYTYDDEGNRTRRESLGGGDIWVYAYDHRNRLVLAQHQDTDESAVDAEYTFQYDVFGNRIEVSQDDDGEGEGSAVVTRFAYDGLHIWADLDGGSSLTIRRIFGDQIDEVLARVEGSTVSWYLQDRLGSVREVANNTTGAFTYEMSFDGFGNIASESGAGGDRYLFTGREWFAGLGLYDYRNRAYDPAVGRFLQEDPKFIDAGDANFFRYVFNSPTNFTDPLGTSIFVDDMQNGQSAALNAFANAVVTSAAATGVNIDRRLLTERLMYYPSGHNPRYGVIMLPQELQDNLREILRRAGNQPSEHTRHLAQVLAAATDHHDHRLLHATPQGGFYAAQHELNSEQLDSLNAIFRARGERQDARETPRGWLLDGLYMLPSLIRELGRQVYDVAQGIGAIATGQPLPDNISGLGQYLQAARREGPLAFTLAVGRLGLAAATWGISEIILQAHEGYQTGNYSGLRQAVAGSAFAQLLRRINRDLRQQQQAQQGPINQQPAPINQEPPIGGGSLPPAGPSAQIPALPGYARSTRPSMLAAEGLGTARSGPQGRANPNAQGTARGPQPPVYTNPGSTIPRGPQTPSANAGQARGGNGAGAGTARGPNNGTPPPDPTPATPGPGSVLQPGARPGTSVSAPANRNIQDIYIVGKDGRDIAQLDGTATNPQGNLVGIEQKTAQNVNRINPSTGNPYPGSSPTDWARRQIYDAGKKKVEGIQNGVATRGTNPADTVPNIGQIQQIRTIRFEIDADTPAIRAAVEADLAALRREFPGFNFEATYAGNP